MSQEKPSIICPVSGPWALVYSPSATYRADWVDPVLAWARAHLASHLPSPDTVPDFDTMFLGAQSSGAHVAVNYLALREDQVKKEPGSGYQFLRCHSQAIVQCRKVPFIHFF